MKKVKVGLIGCGGRLRGVVENLLKATSQVEIVALSDPNPASIQKAKEMFNPQALCHEDYQQLLQDPEIDWVMIGSWNCFHAEQVIAAFEAGKHVFCEKPLALTVEDCLAMREAWLKSGKLFSIGFTLRYSPHYRKIKEILSQGRLGNIISMEFNETLDFNHGGYIHGDWRRKTEWAGSHMLEKCCHDIDLVNWMLDSKAEKVASFGACDFFTPENAHHIERVGCDQEGRQAFQTWYRKDQMGSIQNPFNADKDILDNQVAILQYENGVHATFHTNCSSAFPERRMVFCGSEGSLRADVITGKIEFKRIGFDTPIEDLSTSANGGHGGGDEILGQSLADSMVDGIEPKTSLDDGLKSAFTAFAMDRAQQSGQVFDLAEMWAQCRLEKPVMLAL